MFIGRILNKAISIAFNTKKVIDERAVSELKVRDAEENLRKFEEKIKRENK